MKSNPIKGNVLSGIFILLAGMIPLVAGFVLTANDPLLAATKQGDVPYRLSPFFEQSVAVFSGFFVKPVYMILALILILFLGKSKAGELKILRWGLISFLAGEAFCSVNYIFFHEESAFFEYLHSFGMVIGFSFIFLALIQGLDKRVLKFSDPQENCALLGLCNGCSKYTDSACRLRQLFQFLLPALFVTSIIPLTAKTISVSYNTTIWGTVYNYSHAVIHQFYEIRFCPWAAGLFFIVSFLFLLIRKERGIQTAKIFFAIGLGHLIFSLLRMILLDGFHLNMVWFIFWEETTELIFIGGIGYFLWLFRNKLFKLT
jgi:hypothetical protein